MRIRSFDQLIDNNKKNILHFNDDSGEADVDDNNVFCFLLYVWKCFSDDFDDDSDNDSDDEDEFFAILVAFRR